MFDLGFSCNVPDSKKKKKKPGVCEKLKILKLEVSEADSGLPVLTRDLCFFLKRKTVAGVASVRFPISSALLPARKVSRRGLSLTSTYNPPHHHHPHDPTPAHPDEVLGWLGLGVGGISGLSGAETSVGDCGGIVRGP